MMKDDQNKKTKQNKTKQTKQNKTKRTIKTTLVRQFTGLSFHPPLHMIEIRISPVTVLIADAVEEVTCPDRSMVGHRFARV
jgi:hypothetical protein